MNKFLALPAMLLLASGCATIGSGLEFAGKLSGNSQLAGAGKSFVRSAETDDFNEDEKYYTGRTVAAQLLQNEKVSDDTELEKYVGRVGNTLALSSGMAGQPHGWHFILLKDTEPNAYACPGGLIFVSTGLVKLAASEDELAGALAHEISHIALNHPMQAITAANKKAAFMQLASGAVAAATKGQELSALTSTFDGVVKEVGQAVGHGYDRGKEAEADKNAVGMLIETGYDPRGLKRILGKLKGGDHSHGDPAKRAEAVEAACYEAEPVPEVLAARTDRFKKAIGE